MLHRPRRNRQNHSIRDLVRQTHIEPSKLVMPIFCVEGSGIKEPIKSMPKVNRFSLDLMLEEVKKAYEVGIRSVALFPKINDDLKDSYATNSYADDCLMLRAIRLLKKEIPEVLIFADIAMDPYSSDGHDGVVKDGEILNDETLEVLGKMALAQAKAGADYIAPSDMMDGRVGYLRNILDEHGFTKVGIMSYTAKYASSFYGPFRDALDSAPRGGDKKTYQMDPANATEALRELRLDESEGADIVMVKPALTYMDIIKSVKENTHLPVAAYFVSGEYSMIMAAAQNGWLNEKDALLEALIALRRAGADIIFCYNTIELATWLNE